MKRTATRQRTFRHHLLQFSPKLRNNFKEHPPEIYAKRISILLGVWESLAFNTNLSRQVRCLRSANNARATSEKEPLPGAWGIWVFEAAELVANMTIAEELRSRNFSEQWSRTLERWDANCLSSAGIYGQWLVNITIFIPSIEFARYFIYVKKPPCHKPEPSVTQRQSSSG